MLTNFYKSRLGALVHGRRWISIIWKSAAVTVEVAVLCSQGETRHGHGGA
ncbi:unnamed protein product [Ascophyllum nodosum]